jgi:hypothetical protein
VAVLLWGHGLSHAFEDPYEKYRKNTEEEFDYDDSGDVPWKEQAGAIPSMPDLDEMLTVPVDNDDFEVSIDPNTLNIGKDRVVRYWVALKSQQGAVNAMYEGINCSTKEYKTYAFGDKSGKVTLMKQPRWMPNQSVQGKSFRQELGQDYLCNFGLPRIPREILDQIKDAHRGNFSKEGNTGPAAFF